MSCVVISPPGFLRDNNCPIWCAGDIQNIIYDDTVNEVSQASNLFLMKYL